jgi:hypothetical protein
MSCEESGLFKKEKGNPCTKKKNLDDVLKCDYYPGFKEYYCECTKETDYCDDPDNASCLDGYYAETMITLNGGRKFWNCKDESAAWFNPNSTP